MTRQSNVAVDIVSETNRLNYLNTSRVTVVPKFTSPIPDGPARYGQENGSNVLEKHGLPGVPTRKCSKDDKVPEGFRGWVVQNVFITKSNRLLSTYVGFNVIYQEEQKFETFKIKQPEAMNTMMIRNQFLEVIKKTTRDPEVLRCVDRDTNMLKALYENETHKFWLYEEITYYHSKMHLDYGWAPFSYMCLREDMVDPPKYQYSCVNVVEENAFRKCINNEANKTFDELKKKVGPMKPEGRTSSCEKGNRCKCNKLFSLLYKKNPDHPDWERQNLQPNKHGHLNLRGFDNNNHRILVECSDACGCSKKCPRRRLQQGQSKRLVVFCENSVIGFGLRAAESIRAGEFITEYTGNVLVPRRCDGRDPSYDVEINVMETSVVIDGCKIGSIGRFASHACSSNSVFIETHSREFETDPLIPRISMYALKDIAVGEAITLSYYQDWQMHDRRGIKCACLPDCPNFLPMS